VHGVLAARIPGFESYIQYHLDAPLDDLLPEQTNGERRVGAMARFDGLAEVTFKNADKRLGLATSSVTTLIQEHEKNVFRTSLLFNLNEGASQAVFTDPVARPPHGVFILLRGLPGCTRDSIVAALDALLLPALRAIDSLHLLRTHVLLSGEQQSWITEGVDNQQTADTAFDAIVHLGFADAPTWDSLRTALAAAPDTLYLIDRADANALRSLLERSVAFRHRKLALQRCLQAEQMGIIVAPELLAYCRQVADGLPPAVVQAIVANWCRSTPTEY
jgi:hypothetical protein